MDGSSWPRVPGGDPRLLVTGHFVFAGQVGGAEHMFYNLVRGLGAGGNEPLVLCADTANLDPAFVAELRPGRLLACGGGSGSRFVAEQRACFHPRVRAEAVLFPNYFVPPVVPGRLGRVTTVVHDIQYRHFPQHFPTRKRLWLAASQAFSMRRADRVVAISTFVRDDLVRLYGSRFERKLVAIPNPISWKRFEHADARRPLERPFILSVAAQYAHKNLHTLLRAFALVAKHDPDPMLVFCGQSGSALRGDAGRSGKIMALAEELGLADRVLETGYVDDATLGRWYRHAEMFAFPSLFEGFGMPPVEALGFGLPTLTTARTALPEVTMGLAVTIDDPMNAEAWADRIREVRRNREAARPSAEGVARLRANYDPARIGRLYGEACLA